MYVRGRRVSPKLLLWLITGSVLWMSGVPFVIAYLLPWGAMAWWWWQRGLAARYRDWSG